MRKSIRDGNKSDRSDQVPALIDKSRQLKSMSISTSRCHWRTTDMTKRDKERNANSEDTSSKEEHFDLDQFAEAMSKPGPEEKAFFARRRDLGLGVGLSEDGEIIYARSPREK